MTRHLHRYQHDSTLLLMQPCLVYTMACYDKCYEWMTHAAQLEHMVVDHGNFGIGFSVADP